MLDKFVSKFKKRVMLGLQATGTGSAAYAAPTAGTNAIVIEAIATMGNAADLALTLNYADDASGTNATAYPVNVVVYKNGVRQTDAKAFTVGDATGSHFVEFVIDPATVPAGKFVGLAYANSNAANFVTTRIVEEVSYSL